MQDANLVRARLQDANLGRAQLQGATLDLADMHDAFLYGAQLQGASLWNTQLQGASLWSAQLQGASLHSAQLQGVNLDGAQLQGAYLKGAQLQGATLYDAQLQGAFLEDAELQGARLERARMQGARLELTKLQGALLGGATVWRANGRPSMNLTDVAGVDLDTIPWPTNSTFASWREAVLEAIPPGTTRDEAQSRLSALDPEKKPEDVIQEQFWEDAVSESSQGEEREKQLAAFLVDLACSREGAPYVARGLIGNGSLWATRAQIASVADRMRRGKSDHAACPGVRGFSDDDWAKLDELVVDASK